MAEIGLLALVLGAVALVSVAVRRPLGAGLVGPTGFWAWACAAIFASGFCTIVAGEFAWSLPLGYALGTAYPALLLCGAFAYAGRRAPVWTLAAAAGIGLARGLLALAGAPEAAHAIALALEPGAVVLAAAIVAASVPSGSASFAQRILGPALLVMAGIEMLSAALHLRSGATPLPVQAAFMLGSPVLLAVQIAAVARRAEVALRRSRHELERRVEERTAELLESEARYRVVSELSSDYAFALRMSADHRELEIDWVTDGLERITGLTPEDLEREGWQSRVRTQDGGPLRDEIGHIVAGRLRDVEIQVTTRAGEVRHLSVLIDTLESGPDGAIRVVGVGRDITERKRAEADARRLEDHLHEAQRIESLGVLAGGIAHDFNNMLAVILGNTRLARDELEVGTPPGKRLDRIEAAATHATRLTQQMLTYSGNASVSLRPLDLSALLRDLGELLQVSMADRGRVELELAADLPSVEADATQLRQVVLNLVTNAAECFEEGEGHVRVRTGRVEADAALLADGFGASDAQPGDYVLLEVSDDGPGLAPDVAQRAFEPFFTTKTTGHGLGLAAVLGIVRAHGGVVKLRSEPGSGSSFEVLLPASSRRVERDEVAPTPSVAPPLRAPGGRVLVVDDDESVREVARAFLERAGFEVWSAAGGRDALELLGARASEFDVVVLDLRMPEMGGERVFLEMRRIRPDLPVVLTSGYDERRAAQRFSSRGVAAFVGKPFEPEALVEAVRGAIARAASGALY